MADDDIQGTVTDADGNAVGGAIVALWDQDNPNKVVTTTADSNGNYTFTEHPDGDGFSTNWHLAARDPDDGTRQFPSIHSVSAQFPASIPDSVDDRWKHDEGSGTTISNSKGSVALSASSPNWISNTKYTGGEAVEYKGGSAFYELASNINLNGSQASFCFWADGLTESGDEFSRILGVGDTVATDSAPDNGYVLMFEGTKSSEVRFHVYDGGSLSFQSGLSVPDLSQDDYFICLRVNGDTIGLRVYDGSAIKKADHSASLTRGQTSNADIRGMIATNGKQTTGIIDDAFANQGSVFTESEEQEMAKATER